MAATYTHEIIKELLETVFSVLSAPRPYDEEQLSLQENAETAVIWVVIW
jgi:hypothetical protein